MKKLIILLAGGFSEERDISLLSAKAIYSSLLRLNYKVETIDPKDYSSWIEFGKAVEKMKPYIVFNGLHGGVGENGNLQSLLNLLNIPVTGSGYQASVLSMDKTLSFKLAESLNIKVAPYYVITRREWIKNRSNCLQYLSDRKQETGHLPVNIESLIPGTANRQTEFDDLDFPLVVKPNDSGSSFGIHIVDDQKALEEGVNDAFHYSKKVIIQKYISGSELTVSILGDTPLPIVEIITKEGWYDFNHKYTKGKTEYVVPADIPSQTASELQYFSKVLFQEIGCRAYARIDYRYDGTDYYFLEVNTLPGMTSLSLTPMAAEKAGIPFDTLIQNIVEYSLSE